MIGLTSDNGFAPLKDPPRPRFGRSFGAFILGAIAAAALFRGPPGGGRTVGPPPPPDAPQRLDPYQPPASAGPVGEQGWRAAVDRHFWASTVSGLLYTLGAAWIIFGVAATVATAALNGVGKEMALASALGVAILFLIQSLVMVLVGQALGRVLRLVGSGAFWEQFSMLVLWVVVIVTFPYVFPESMTPPWLPKVHAWVVVFGWIASVTAVALRRRWNWCGRIADWLGLAVGLAALVLGGLFMGVVARFIVMGTA